MKLGKNLINSLPKAIVQENANRDASTSPGLFKLFKKLGKNKWSRRQANWKDAKLKISENTGAKIPSDCEELTVFRKIFNMMVTRFEIEF